MNTEEKNKLAEENLGLVYSVINKEFTYEKTTESDRENYIEEGMIGLAKAINTTKFNKPIIPVYQNITTTAVSDPEEIKQNLIKQLTGPVKWTQSVRNMIKDGATNFVEVGPGKTLQGLIKKIDSAVETSSAF